MPVKPEKVSSGVNKKKGGTGKKGDQRTARSERSKEAICKAMVDLLDEGILMPTAKKIAEYAGVSVRLVFHHFEDLEAIRKELVNRQFLKIQPMVEFDVPSDIPSVEKIDRFVSHRAGLLEYISPVRKVAVSMEPHSRSIFESLQWIREFKRKQVEAVFMSDLSIYSEEEISRRLSALQVALSWPAWNSLRAHQGLDVETAQSVIRKMVQCIIGSA